MGLINIANNSHILIRQNRMQPLKRYPLTDELFVATSKLLAN